MTPRGLKAVARKAALVVVFGATALVLSGCSFTEALALGWPKGITPEAHVNRELWIGSMIAALVVGGIVYVLIFWVSAFHRKKASDTELPRQFGYNMPLELVLTVIPFLIISVLFYFTVVVQEEMLAKEGNPEVVIDVTAFQWNWKFGYNKVNFTDGTMTYDGVDEERSAAIASRPGEEGAGAVGEPEAAPTEHGAIAGQTPEDRSYLAFDDIETLGTSDEIPILVLPSEKRIEFRLASADVAHAFWVPEFLFKRDVVPGRTNTFEITIRKEGRWVGRCAELCGEKHARMNFYVRAVSPQAYDQFVSSQKSSGAAQAAAPAGSTS